MEELKTNEMSNSELKLKLLSYENEYEVIKNNIEKYVKRMNELDIQYNKVQAELKKRNVI